MLTDIYCASLAPGQAVLLRVRRGLRPTLVEKRHANCDRVPGAQPWQAELQLLAALLDQSKHRLPLTVVLSNHLVRYRLVPAAPPLMAAKEAMALVKYSFREVYGDIADQWVTRVNPLSAGDAAVACAVDAALLEGLQAVCRQRGLKLRSVLPYLMAGFNPAKRQIRRAATCFVQVESGRCVIGLVQNGTWHALNAAVVPSQWTEELPSLIRREMLLAGWDSERPQIVLCAHEARPISRLPGEDGWPLRHVTPRKMAGYVPLNDMPFAMALSGA